MVPVDPTRIKEQRGQENLIGTCDRKLSSPKGYTDIADVSNVGELQGRLLRTLSSFQQR